MLKLIAVALCTAATLLVVVAIPRPLHRNVREEFEDSCTLDEESLGTVYEHDDDLEDGKLSCKSARIAIAAINITTSFTFSIFFQCCLWCPATRGATRRTVVCSV